PAVAGGYHIWCNQTPQSTRYSYRCGELSAIPDAGDQGVLAADAAICLPLSAFDRLGAGAGVCSK
ncbi:MAG: hypothetical protein Q8K93_32675, partial [Reyranella sp.]|nr:hypothetical protein [Reyranella sp.]